VIRGIEKAWLSRSSGRPKLWRLEVPAIYKIYIVRTHTFRTIVIDWKTGPIVFVGHGKGQDW
jgi:hypothetical protein